MSNDCLEIALSELAAVGISPEISRGGKHIRMHWKVNGNSRSHTIPLTPSDWRSPLNSRTQIRATLREDGLIANDNDLPAEADRPKVEIRGGAIFASSLDIARHFSKAHKDVLRAIDNIIDEVGEEFSRRNFTPSTYVNDRQKEYRCFEISRDGFSLLVMGFTGDAAMTWKLRYIDAFNKMELEIRRASELISMPVGIMERLARVEADLKALIDLSLGRDAAPGFVYVKAHKRRLRHEAKAV